MSKIEIEIEITELQKQLNDLLNLKGNSKLKWKYISEIEYEIEILKKLINAGSMNMDKY